MTLLGLDTATAASVACVLRKDGEHVEVLPEPDRLRAPPAHARELMPAVAEAVSRAGVSFGDLEAIAVGIGPGGFTGLRIGVASARALASATGIGLRPVSSLRALAAGLGEADPGLGGLPRLPLIDAKRGELFAALYERGEERWPPFVTSPEALLERLREERVTPLAGGDGSLRFEAALRAAGIALEPARSRAHLVSALRVCRLAAGAPGVSPETVFPAYLRSPDANPL